MIIKIIGKKINTEEDFHDQLAKALDIEPYYGRNLNALRDLLRGGVERPAELIWLDSIESKLKLGDVFDKIIDICEKAKSEDEQCGLKNKFSYTLR